jgi:hypothetical protein
VHFDRVGRTEEYISAEGSITFDQEISGLIMLSHTLEATHVILGVESTLYTNNPVELGTPGQYLTISDDRRTLSFKIFVNVITSPVSMVDEPVGGTGGPDDTDDPDGMDDGSDGPVGGIPGLIDALIPDGGLNGESMCGTCGQAGAPTGAGLVASIGAWRTRRRRKERRMGRPRLIHSAVS